MSQELAAAAVPALHGETIGRERGYCKWRMVRASEVFYVVICRPWGDATYRWFISPNCARWVEVSREELRCYIDKTS